jgi:hypothetical protein
MGSPDAWDRKIERFFFPPAPGGRLTRALFGLALFLIVAVVAACFPPVRDWACGHAPEGWRTAIKDNRAGWTAWVGFANLLLEALIVVSVGALGAAFTIKERLQDAAQKADSFADQLQAYRALADLLPGSSRVFVALSALSNFPGGGLGLLTYVLVLLTTLAKAAKFYLESPVLS